MNKRLDIYDLYKAIDNIIEDAINASTNDISFTLDEILKDLKNVVNSKIDNSISFIRFQKLSNKLFHKKEEI